MIKCDKAGNMVKKVIVDYFRTLTRHSSIRTEENQVKSLARKLTCSTRSCRVQIRHIITVLSCLVFGPSQIPNNVRCRLWISSLCNFLSSPVYFFEIKIF
jgi:hypothetical protein